jgi:hypothetical protein
MNAKVRKIRQPRLELIQYEQVQAGDWLMTRRHYKYLHPGGMVLLDVSVMPNDTWLVYFSTARAGSTIDYWQDFHREPTQHQLAIWANKFQQYALFEATRFVTQLQP